MTNKTSTPTKKNKASTRTRLLETAIDVFGTYGYEAATTRMIAKAAGVNISSIPYYFDGKEGLYRAMINHFVTLINSRINGIEMEISETAFNDKNAHQKASELFEQLLNEIITFMIGSPQALRMSRVILREQLDPSSAYHLIFEGFMKGLLEAMANLLTVMQKNLSHRSAKLKAISILGQVIIFRFARETVIRAVDMEGYNSIETDEIRELILAQTRTLFMAL
jgi:AcrR family transcriptional regulator